MRAKDAPRLLTIRGLLAALKQREVDERIVLDDAAVIAIVDKLVKQRKDSIAAVHRRRPPGPGRQGSRRAGGARELPAAAPGRRRDRGRSRRASSPRPAPPARATWASVMAAAKARAGRQGRHGARLGRGQARAREVSRHGHELDLSLPAPSPPTSAVAPQLTPAAMAEAAGAGFRSVINNRPDFEGGPDAADQRGDRGGSAGRRPRVPLPAGRGELPVARRKSAAFARLLASLPRPVLVFCRSGARSTRL